MILHICDNADVLSVMRIVRIVINIIRIAIPIILMIVIMMDIVRAIMDDDKELNTIFPLIVKRLILAIIIFLVPTFVNIIVHVSVGNETTYLSCIENATDDKIQDLRSRDAYKLVAKFRSSRDMQDYNAAVTAAYKIKDAGTRKSLLNELESIRKSIEESNKIESPEGDRTIDSSVKEH